MVFFLSFFKLLHTAVSIAMWANPLVPYVLWRPHQLTAFCVHIPGAFLFGGLTGRQLGYRPLWATPQLGTKKQTCLV